MRQFSAASLLKHTAHRLARSCDESQTLKLMLTRLLQIANLSQKLLESQDELHSTREMQVSLRARVDQYAKKIQVLSAFPISTTLMPATI